MSHRVSLVKPSPLQFRALHMYVCIYLYIVYSQHAPLPSVILHALPDHLHIVLLVSYRIYIMYGSAVRM